MASDFRYALRQLRKSPGFAVTAILTLALGIGANTAIYSTMYAALLRMLPVRNPQQLVYLTHQMMPNGVGDTGDPTLTFGINVYNRLRADNSAFSDIIAYVPLSFGKTPVRNGDTPEEVDADEVSGNFFSALGVHMAAGQPFRSSDEDQHSSVAVISYRYWTRRFHRDPDVIGQPIYVNGTPMTIAGVAGPDFYGVESNGIATDLWVPLQSRPGLPAWGIPPTMHTIYSDPNWWALMLMARLREGVSEQQALAKMNPLFQRAAWETVGKDVNRNSKPLALSLVPARGLGTGSREFRQPLQVLMGMVALVLLIACLNIAMLLTARNAVREREFSMRLALGAGHWPILRQLLAESLLLVGSGAGLGWVFALEATKLLGIWSQIEVSLAPNGSVLVFTLAVSVVAALMFGLAPLRSAVGAPVTLTLKSGGTQTTASRSRVLTDKILIAVQMAFCVVLLIAAGLLVRTLRNYEHIDLVFEADQVLAFGAHPVGANDYAQKLAFYDELTRRIGQLPGVHSVTVAECRPGSGESDNNELILDGREYPAKSRHDLLRSNGVGPNFFSTLGIPVLHGRGITAADTHSAERAAVVNQTFVRRFLNGASPIGHKLGGPKHPFTIVGEVRDTKYISADEDSTPMAWYSYQQAYGYDSPIIPNMDVEVRASGNPLGLLSAIRRIVREIDANAPLQDPKVLSTQFAEGYDVPALFARLSAFFGGLAALLVAVGLYGSLAYRVNRRRLEIGVRVALGAARGQVLWIVLEDSLILVATGLAVGLPLAWFGSAVLASMLYKLPPHDPASFLLAASIVLTVSLAAAWLPARRAASVEPMDVLRTE